MENLGTTFLPVLAPVPAPAQAGQWLGESYYCSLSVKEK